MPGWPFMGSGGGSAFTGALSSGQFSGGAGTKTAPTYSFTGDLDTGIYSPAANQVGVSCADTLIATFSTASILSTVPYRSPVGTAAATAFQSVSNAGSGMWFELSGVYPMIANGGQSVALFDVIGGAGTGAIRLSNLGAIAFDAGTVDSRSGVDVQFGRSAVGVAALYGGSRSVGSSLALASDMAILISSTTDPDGSADTGLARDYAGAIRATNGSTGTGTFLAARVYVTNGGGGAAPLLDLTAAGNVRHVSGALVQWADNASNTGAGTLDTAASRAAANVLRIGSSTTDIDSLLSATLVEANTAGSGSPNILTVGESRTLLTNEGVTAENYHTLPLAAAGLTFTFYVQDTDGIRITANTADTIRVAAGVSAGAGFVRCATAGAVVRLTAINATEWVAEYQTGVWTVDV